MKKLLLLLWMFFIGIMVHAQSVVQITTGTAGAPAYNAGPIYRSSASSAYDVGRYSYLYTQSELAAAGINNGDIITDLGWVKNNNATTTGGGIFRIYMKNSTAISYANATETWANLNAGTTMVYQNLSQTIPATQAPNYIVFTLSSGFVYTGGSLEISTEWDINQVTGNPSTAAFDWLWSTVANSIYGTGQTALSAAGTLSSTTNSISTIDDRRPFLQISYTPGIPCSGTPTAGTASVTARNCASEPLTLSVTGNTNAGGISLQWQSSPAGAGTFTNIPGATTAAYTVTNQTVSTDYRLIVTCSNGNTTATSNTVNAVQPAPLANLSENFDTTATGSSTNATIPACWSYIDEVTTTGYGYVEAADAQSAPKSFRLYRSNSTSNASENLVLISPQTDNLGNGTKQLRFSVMANNTNSSNILQIVIANGTTSSSTFSVLQNIVVDHTGYKEYIVSLPTTTDDYFGFRLAHNNTTTAIDINLDDVYFENRDACFFPSYLAVPAFTETTAVLSWATSVDPNVTGYEYEVRSSGAPGSGATGLAASGTVTGANTTVANVTGLTANTSYTVYIRSICGTTTGKWNPISSTFRTPCVVFGNFTENFDTTSVGTGSKTGANYPDCWSYIDSTTTGYGYVIASNPQSSPNVYRLYRANTASGAASEELVLVSPKTDNLGNGAKQLRFSVRSYITTNYISQLEILSMPDPTSTAGATVLYTINNTNDRVWTEYVVPLPVTTDDYFAFRLAYAGTTTASSVTIDDVNYEDAPAPTLASSHTDILCNGDTIGTATVTATGGALPLTYSWSPSGGTAATATGLAAGTYTVTVTDALNRTATANVTIAEPDALDSNIVTTNITCNGANNGSVVLAPTGGVAPYTYLWDTGATTNSITNLPAGTYSVTITDANGCILTETATITDPAVLAIAGSSHTDVTWYGGNDGSATVSATGGIAPYTYLWSPSGGTNATATGLIAGNYTVTVTDVNGCTTTESFTIIQPIPLMVQSTSKNNIKCNGETNGTATIVAMGGNAPYTYLWSPSGATNATATGLAAGTHSVLVTDSTGNTITESFTITEPGAILTTVSQQSDVLCNGGNNGTATITVTGGTAPFTYTWSNGTVTTNATVSNLMAGNYTVQVTDANGCTATAPVSLTIGQPSALVLTTTGTTNISCYGLNDGSISIAVTGGVAPYAYLWSNGQSGSSINNLGKGTYAVTVTDANNCTQTQSFTITEPAFVTAPTASSQNFCVGQNATLADIVINGSNIKWYSAATGGMLLPATTALVSGTTYYASQTVGTCESTTRTAVQITVGQAPALTTTQLSVCSNTRIQNMMVDGLNYTQLRWYSSATGTIQLQSSILLATGTYYVSSFVGTCESVRQAIQVTVAATVPAPTASFQTVCGGSTLNDLVVVKDPSATLNWYSSMQSMIPLANTTVVATGTYYVQQVLGNCESSRIAVQVQVINITIPTITSITTCEGTTIADLNTNGTNYVWYTDNSTTTRLPSSYVITSGSYYIANENANCISARKNIAVNVSARPASPTGQATQLFNFSAKVSDLVMNEPNVKWFLSANDAAKLINELSATTPLTDATTYYGVIVTPNNCGSLVPTAVTVTINLSNAELDLTQLKYYPNPVDSELNISYIEEIKKVEVFTITGQRVFGNDYQGNEVKVDLSRLSAGTYLVKIETAKASQFVKIVKK